MYFSSGKYFKAALPQSKYAKAGGDGEQGGMVSPMPGKITSIMVTPGTTVKVRDRPDHPASRPLGA